MQDPSTAVARDSFADCGPTGLSADAASARLRRYGPNVVPEAPRVAPWRRFVAQLVHFFAVMLWLAGLLAIVAGLPALGVAIFVVIVINAIFAFAQEYRAERAAEHLRNLLPSTSTVVRDGVRTSVPATELVPGDRVLLESGDRISADLRCVISHGLSVDTSLLTGESVPVSVDVGTMLPAGGFVVEGEGEAVAEATGAATRLAQIAILTQRSTRPQTPLTRELHRLVRTIAAIAVGVGAAFFVVSLTIDTPPSDGFIFAVGITVALVPEGLLPTVTLSLAVGAQRMATHHALVRRLEAVETLGSTTIVCTDKTGTLTQNRMSVVRVWTPAGGATITGDGYSPVGSVHADSKLLRTEVARVAQIALRCSTGRAVERDGVWRAQGDPMEAAIDALARRAGPAPERAEPDLRRFAFDPRRRRSSVVTATEVLVKGAPDSVLEVCVGDLSDASAALGELTGDGLRVLAVAARPTGARPPETVADAERDLRLVGLLALEDPPRPEASHAVADCRRAGIKIVMVTGDHPATAAAIAREIGLWLPGAPILVGADLPGDDQALGAVVDHDGAVIARVAPEDKLRIARALRERGHVVAMTGDGVNDGPALREADIGVAMGRSGTDVAREAADLVLLDDNFATILAAVRQGRATFANARRFLTYHLTDNVAELTPFAVWALSGDRFPLALGVLQVLALDIGTDTLSAAALGADAAADDVLDRPPVTGRLLNRTVAFRAFGVLGPVEAVCEMAAFVVCLVAAGWRPGEPFPTGSALAAASGAAFLTVVFAQSANAFACRSTRLPAWAIPVSTNPYLLWAVAGGLVVASGFILIPPVANLLEHRLPPLAGWAVALGAIPLVLVADATWKRARRATLR